VFGAIVLLVGDQRPGGHCDEAHAHGDAEDVAAQPLRDDVAEAGGGCVVQQRGDEDAGDDR
jgi:hypothetical protein